MAGGLAAALLPAVRNAGAIWVGSSGKLSSSGNKDPLAEVQPLGAGALATVDMPGAHYHRYYEGFANSVLWPAFHSRADLIRSHADDHASYCEINAFMARALMRFVRSESVLWIHDYHFLTLGSELRQRGVTQPIGFFLHTPFPSRSMMTSVPHHRDLIIAMLSYDLIGFQTDDDLANFTEYLTFELRLNGENDVFYYRGRAIRLATFPIGIDAESFAERATRAAARPEVARLRASLQGRKLAIGVDRLDYSKGLLARMRALDLMFEVYPETRKTVNFLQIAVPTREQIGAYQELQQELAATVGEVNGRHADVDWTPIRYINKSFSQAALAGFYRSAEVGLVTPFHDGMNLVAKEYVAAQNPLDPGVLVLSEFAGAAKQLDAALLVNPHDIDGMAKAVMRALTMPIGERRERWSAMIECLKESSLDAWFDDFIGALEEVRVGGLTSSPPIAVPSPATSPAAAMERDIGTALGR